MEVLATTGADETLLLDLLNSTPVVDGVPTDVLADRVTAGAWLRQHEFDDDVVETLMSARAALQAVVRGDEDPSVLNRFVSGASLQPVVTDAGIEWRLEAEPADAAAARAVLAWDALRITSPGRLRPCANTECQLFLIDRSKPNNARWCSMSLCGNRMKARRHYRRTRDDSE